jgi:hypothetical protein
MAVRRQEVGSQTVRVGLCKAVGRRPTIRIHTEQPSLD